MAVQVALVGRLQLSPASTVSDWNEACSSPTASWVHCVRFQLLCNVLQRLTQWPKTTQALELCSSFCRIPRQAFDKQAIEAANRGGVSANPARVSGSQRLVAASEKLPKNPKDSSLFRGLASDRNSRRSIASERPSVRV